jgi:hypothetical protein
LPDPLLQGPAISEISVPEVIQIRIAYDRPEYSIDAQCRRRTHWPRGQLAGLQRHCAQYGWLSFDIAPEFNLAWMSDNLWSAQSNEADS